jgi:phosphodiesterase/alkaline phosphatase D-like protein
MKIHRRDLLKLGLVQVLTVGLSKKGQAKESLNKPLKQNRPSVLQGATEETRTQFSILYNEDVTLNLFVTSSNGRQWQADRTQEISFSKHPQKITKAFFSNLSPDETYFLHIENAETNTVLDKREFQTLNMNSDKVRFAFCSCMDDQHHEEAIWKDIAIKKPQIIFFIGDHVYADNGRLSVADPAQLWSRFCDARQTLNVFFAPRLVPILATWDDHDFGKNDGHSENYPYVKESQLNFKTFFAQEEDHCQFLIQGPGISTAFKWNSQLFLLLDDRSFRKPKHSKERYAHWGKEQEKWMLDLIQKNVGPTWLVNGSQIFPKMPFKESVSGNHQEQFYGILEELKKMPSKVIFVSGDVHFSEISKIEKNRLGYNTYEITSSSIHSPCISGAHHYFSNPRRMVATSLRNYILVDSEAQVYGSAMKVSCFDSEGDTLFQLNLSV